MTEQIIEQKWCSKCRTTKPIVEFYSNRSTRDGLTYWCKTCVSKDAAQRKARYQASNKPLKTEKRCSRCKQTRPIGDFDNDIGRLDGKAPECKQCRHDRWVDYAQTDAGKAVARKADRKFKNKWRGTSQQQMRNRSQNLKKDHNLTVNEYERIFASQDGQCAICKRETKKHLCVDHDHSTGVIRGLLCHHCNRILGIWKDSPEAAQRALDYLLKFRQLRLVV